MLLVAHFGYAPFLLASCTLTLLLQWAVKQFQGTSDSNYPAPPNINQSLKLRSISFPDLLYVANLLPLSIHSHIQGPVFAEGEASLRLIHLHGGTASIQQNSINAAWLNVHVRQQGFKLAKSAKQWFHTTTEERIVQWDICISMHMVQLLSEEQ